MSDIKKINRAFQTWLETEAAFTEDEEHDAYLAYRAGYAQAEADAAGKE